MIDALLEGLSFPEGAHALDLGCGDGALLLRLALAHGMRVTGVDRSEAALARARARFDAAGAAGAATWRSDDAATLDFEDDTFDLIAWLGGPFVGGGHASTLEAFARWLRPDGVLLLGLGSWTAPPPDAYLEATGLSRDDLQTEDVLRADVRAAGFVVERRVPSTRAHWRHFEDTLLANHERLIDAEAEPERLAAKRGWHAAQVRWGLDCMGFALLRARLGPQA